MGRARNWESLSDPYRNRLERFGLDRTSYEAGANLKAARGHGLTPENLKDAARNPDKYDRWIDNKSKQHGWTKDETKERLNLRLDKKWDTWTQAAGKADQKTGLDSQFEDQFKAAKDSKWDPSQDGAWADLLALIDLRDDDWGWAVGDTPSASI